MLNTYYSAFHVIASSICTLLLLTIGVYVLSRDPKSVIYRTFMGTCVCVAIWLSWFYVGYFLDPASPLGKFWPKFIYVGTTFIIITLFHYVVRLLNLTQYRRLIKVTYTVGFILSLFILTTDLFLKEDYYIYSWGPYPHGGPLMGIYQLCFVAFVLRMIIYPSIQTVLSPESSAQSRIYAKYFLAAASVLSFAMLDFLPAIGFDIYPIGYIPVTLFTSILAYAIVKHRFMDIDIVIKRGIVYSITISLITVFYFVAVIVSERIFKDIIGYEGSFVVMIIIAFIFTPLKNFIQNLADKIFFKGTPAEIAEENAMLRREIARADRYKTLASLIDNIAHEMKDPLTALIVYNHALTKKLNDPEFLQKFSEVFKKETTRIRELIETLSSYSQPAPLSIEKTNIIRLINETLGMLKDKFIQSKIEVFKYYDEKSSFNLNIDPQQIRQALLNILLNAIEAMPEGGQVWVGAERQGNEFHISVSDTGCGIRPEHLTRIFDPFFKLKKENRGLGLSVVQSIVEGHGGRIDVESEIDAGSEFFIKLPIT